MTRENLIISLLIVAALSLVILAYYLSRKKGRARFAIQYKIAHAGDPGKSSRSTAPGYSIWGRALEYKGKIVVPDERVHDIFIVEGNSMTQLYIDPKDGILVEKIKDPYGFELQKGTIIVYKRDPDRHVEDNKSKKKVFGYKIRCFVGRGNLSQSNEEICAQLNLASNPLTADLTSERLCEKLDKCREWYQHQKENEAETQSAKPARKTKTDKKDQEIIISITHKNGKRDFSVHYASELYGNVMFVIPKDVLSTAA